MHEPLAGAALRVAVFEVPACCLEGGSCGAGVVVVAVAVAGWAGMAGMVGVFFAFGGELVFLMADHSWSVVLGVLGLINGYMASYEWTSHPPNVR